MQDPNTLFVHISRQIATSINSGQIFSCRKYIDSCESHERLTKPQAISLHGLCDLKIAAFMEAGNRRELAGIADDEQSDARRETVRERNNFSHTEAAFYGLLPHPLYRLRDADLFSRCRSL